jgi:phosphoribosylanthranilate isomerase
MNGPGERRVRVKICGVCNRKDAEAAVALGADALGFNLFAGSRRCIDLDREASWIAALPPFVTRVAVLVNAPLEEALRVSAHPAIDMVQFHGNEDTSYCAEFARRGRPFIKALRLQSAEVLKEAMRFSTNCILLDAHVPGAFGGTGAAVDLDLAAAFARQHPKLTVILAGGLTPANVGKAVRHVRPFAVDVASGVELEPRRKDLALMQSFIEAVGGGERLNV